MTNILDKLTSKLIRSKSTSSKDGDNESVVAEIINFIESRPEDEVIDAVLGMKKNNLFQLLEQIPMLRNKIEKLLVEQNPEFLMASVQSLDNLMKLSIFPDIKSFVTHRILNFDPLQLKMLCPEFENYLTFVEILSDEEIKTLFTLVIENDLLQAVPMHIYYLEVLIRHLSNNEALGGFEMLEQMLNYIFSDKKHLKELVSERHSLIRIFEKLPSSKLKELFVGKLLEHEIIPDILHSAADLKAVEEILSSENRLTLEEQMSGLGTLKKEQIALFVVVENTLKKKKRKIDEIYDETKEDKKILRSRTPIFFSPRGEERSRIQFSLDESAGSKKPKRN